MKPGSWVLYLTFTELKVLVHCSRNANNSNFDKMQQKHLISSYFLILLPPSSFLLLFSSFPTQRFLQHFLFMLFNFKNPQLKEFHTMKQRENRKWPGLDFLLSFILNHVNVRQLHFAPFGFYLHFPLVETESWDVSASGEQLGQDLSVKRFRLQEFSQLQTYVKLSPQGATGGTGIPPRILKPCG